MEMSFFVSLSTEWLALFWLNRAQRRSEDTAYHL
jgi:hypothetical protein